MPLKDLLKKKERDSNDEIPPSATQRPSHIPEFIFVRSDTTTEEIIQPPTFPADSESANASSSDAPTTPPRRLLGRLRKGSNASTASQTVRRMLDGCPIDFI